jgi:hypothetical protein
MLLTMSLASGEGDHFSIACDAVLARASIDCPYSVVSFGRHERECSPRHAFDFLLFGLREGGNRRYARGCSVADGDIPAREQFGIRLTPTFVFTSSPKRKAPGYGRGFSISRLG